MWLAPILLLYLDVVLGWLVSANAWPSSEFFWTNSVTLLVVPHGLLPHIISVYVVVVLFFVDGL